jgi:alkylhydroperoxidase family enzyme
MSARRAVARPAGPGDLMESVLDFERSALAERQKVALRLTDAFLAHPAGFDDAARHETLEHFSPEQIVELLLKLTAWTVNKTATALGLDDPIDADRLTRFHYDAGGHLVLHPATGSA